MPKKKLPSPQRRCQMKREDGQQCRAARLRDSDYCLFHHPWTQKHRRKLFRIDELALRGADDVHELLVSTLLGVKEGKINPQQAYAIGWLVRVVRENREELERERAAAKQESQLEEEEPDFAEPAELEEEGQEWEIASAEEEGEGGEGKSEETTEEESSA